MTKTTHALRAIVEGIDYDPLRLRSQGEDVCVLTPPLCFQ